MIVVRLFGGLGNQLFQYATGRRAALRRGVELAVDCRWFDSQSLRAPALEDLRVAIRGSVPEARLPDLPADWTGAGRRARVMAGLQSRRRGWHLVTERRAGVFDESVLSARDSSFLVGYWQSEQYFSDIRDSLREELRPRQARSPWATALESEIRASGGVSLHIRRGDYAAGTRAVQTHGVLSLDYYRTAIRFLDERLGNPTYYVFSDDPGWADEHLRLPRLRLVPPKAVAPSAVEELTLMSACRAHVIANSTFSWWGAWLGDEANKTVIAPARWFASPHVRSDDIVPRHWVRL